jgi:hypothetical protein
MRMNSFALRVTGRRLLAMAFIIAVGTPLAIGADSHVVTIDVTKSPITYSDTKNGALQSGSAYRLSVGNKDSVVWKAVTPENAPYSAMIFFPNGTPFADNSGRPVVTIVWSDRITTSPEADIVEQSGTYEFYVAVYDELHKTSYTEDPKIIVGGGGTEADVKISSAVDDLQQAHDQLSRNPKLRGQSEQLEAIKKELQHILAELER